MRRLIAAASVLLSLAVPAMAQQLDLSSGGPIDITARDGIEWRQNERQVIARGDARAIRNNVTVTADRLTAWYRKKGGNAAAEAPATGAGLAAADSSTEGSEVYRLQADGNVHIYTQADHAQGDKATYAKRVAADTLVAYTTDNPQPRAAQAAAKPTDDPIAASGKLQRVEAFGHVSIRTPTDTVTGDRGVYVPDTGMARLAGNVQITRGQNQLNGAEANVNMKTGIATLVARNAGRVHGLVVPNDDSSKSLGLDPAGGGKAGTPAPAKP
jgi:lipopolysaccharide export system protein LptA